MSPTKKNSKQGRIPIDMFIKNPSAKLSKKHEKLVGKEKPFKGKLKIKLSKKEQEKKKESTRVFEGAQRWLKYLESCGTEDIESKRPDLLFQVYGEPPSKPNDPYDLKYSESDLDVSTSDEMLAINASLLDDESDDDSINVPDQKNLKTGKAEKYWMSTILASV